MKKRLIVFVISMLFLAGCGQIEGIVVEKKEASFLVETSSGDSESSEQEVFLTDHTIFGGEISSYEELEEGDNIRVVPFDTPRDFPYFLASEVISE